MFLIVYLLVELSSGMASCDGCGESEKYFKKHGFSYEKCDRCLKNIICEFCLKYCQKGCGPLCEHCLNIHNGGDCSPKKFFVGFKPY